MNESQQKAFDSIVTQWNGGERTLAGARASELVYGAGKKPNQKLLDQLAEEIPGVERYISAPNSGVVVDTIQDDTGNPLSTLPEVNQGEGGQNQSSDQAKAEQNAIDDVLKAGREARENKQDEREDNPLGSTELNPSDPLDHDKDGRKGGHIDNRGKPRNK